MKTQKSQNKSLSNPQQLTKGQTQANPVEQNMIYFESSVAQLETQQNQLDPLVNLIESIPLLQKISEYGKQMLSQFKQVDGNFKQHEFNAEENKRLPQDLDYKQEDKIMEEISKRCNENKQMLQFLHGIENDFKQQDLENKLSFKNLQVWSKEEIINLVENLETKVQLTQELFNQEMENLMQGLGQIEEVTLKQKIAIGDLVNGYIECSTNDLIDKDNNIAPQVGNYIGTVKQQLTSFKCDLIEELNQSIQFHYNEAKKEIFQKYQVYNFRFSQEMVLLRQGIEKIRDLFEEKIRSDILKHSLISEPEDKIVDVNQEIRVKLDILTAFSTKTYEYIEIILIQIQEILEKFGDKINQMNQILQEQEKNQEEEEALKFQEQEEIKLILEQVKCQLQFCSQNVDKVSIKCLQEAGKIQDNMKQVLEINEQLQRNPLNDIDQKNLIKKESDTAESQAFELSSLKKDISNKSDIYLREIQNQRNILGALLSRAVNELGMRDLELMIHSAEKQKQFQSLGGDEEPDEETSEAEDGNIQIRVKKQFV